MGPTRTAGYGDVRGMEGNPGLNPVRERPWFPERERTEILPAEERRRVEAERWGESDRSRRPPVTACGGLWGGSGAAGVDRAPFPTGSDRDAVEPIIAAPPAPQGGGSSPSRPGMSASA